MKIIKFQGCNTNYVCKAPWLDRKTRTLTACATLASCGHVTITSLYTPRCVEKIFYYHSKAHVPQRNLWAHLIHLNAMRALRSTYRRAWAAECTEKRLDRAHGSLDAQEKLWSRHSRRNTCAPCRRAWIRPIEIRCIFHRLRIGRVVKLQRRVPTRKQRCARGQSLSHGGEF